MSDTWDEYTVKCKLCGAMNKLIEVETDNPTLPNTLTDLKDHNTPIWKCNTCGGWNGNED